MPFEDAMHSDPSFYDLFHAEFIIPQRHSLLNYREWRFPGTEQYFIA
jgi:hypothetical protein